MDLQFADLVKSSKRIVVTSHVSPDVDAVCSSVLLSEILRLNFPEKVVTNALDERPARDLTLINGYERIVFGPLITAVEDKKPDLFIITDTDSFGRVSKQDGEALGKYIKAHNVKTIVIDHHELSGIDRIDLIINRGTSCASQEIYRLCFQSLNMKKPTGYDQTTMIGILDDTNRFMYYYPHYSETMAIAGELMEGGVDVQKLDSRLRRYNQDQMQIMGHLISNLHVEDGFTYTFISDAFATKWLKDGKDIADFKRGKADFVDTYIRNVDENMWGFVVAQDLTQPGVYFSSLRATRGTIDVAKLAQSMNGNGHSESAATRIDATSMEAAVKQMLDGIARFNRSA